MARPRKDGLEYFPHDVYASSDEKIEPLLLLYGAKGYAFYFLHLEYIYRNSDLTFDISDAETREVIQQKLQVSSEEYEKILQTAIKKKCFDKDFFEQTGRLTSEGIKKRAGTVIEKRLKMKSAYERKVSADFCNVSDAETTHIKESKSKVKVKESKSNIKTSSSSGNAREGKVFQFFNQNIGPITPFQAESIGKYLDDGLDPELIIEVLKDSLGADNPWKYGTKILEGCKSQNIFTKASYQAKKVEKKNRAPNKKQLTTAEKIQSEAMQRFINGGDGDG